MRLLPRPTRISAQKRRRGWLVAARLPHRARVPDERFDVMRRPRADWLNLLAGFTDFAEGESKSRFGAATRHIRDTGVSYRVYGEESGLSWPLQPLPLILGQCEWAEIAASAIPRKTFSNKRIERAISAFC